MPKESKKQIKAQAINECSKQYRSQIEDLKLRLVSTQTNFAILASENKRLRLENIELKDELEKYQDWNRRLQEFMDMEPDVREKALAEIELQTETNSRLKRVFAIFSHLI